MSLVVNARLSRAVAFAALTACAGAGFAQEPDPTTENPGVVIAQAPLRDGSGSIEIRHIVEADINNQILATVIKAQGDFSYEPRPEWSRLENSERARLIFEELTGQSFPAEASRIINAFDEQVAAFDSAWDETGIEDDFFAGNDGNQLAEGSECPDLSTNPKVYTSQDCYAYIKLSKWEPLGSSRKRRSSCMKSRSFATGFTAQHSWYYPLDYWSTKLKSLWTGLDPFQTNITTLNTIWPITFRGGASAQTWPVLAYFQYTSHDKKDGTFSSHHVGCLHIIQH